MQSFLMFLVLLIWVAGTIWRIYKQARFYQIEEYKSNRYLRWLISERGRWLPNRTFIGFIAGVIIGFFTDSIPGETSIVPYMAAIFGAIIATWPPSEGEIKKHFVRTSRATRMLGTAFALAMVLGASFLLALPSLPIPESDRFQAVAIAVGGFLMFIGAPLWLIAGNLLMTPVESFNRTRFVRQAAQVLDDVQPKIIGITGSYGKTTTKNFLRDILNGRYKTYATPKSYNTLMGVCIAINNDLANDYSIEYFISEMGAYVEGEIERIANLTKPSISIVVEVGPQHLERFGSLQNIATAKYEIIKALPPDGLGIFNWDNPYVRDMYERGYPQNRIAVSKSIAPEDAPQNGPRFIATDIAETLDGLSFTVHDVQTGDSVPMTTPVVGEHNVMNLLLSTAVAVHEGMSLRDVAFRVRALQPAESRLVRQTVEGGITVINDAYSANPVGVLSALKVLSMHTGGERLLITPGMVELGDLHDEENHKLGLAAAKHASYIILVGEEQTAAIKRGVLESNFPTEKLQTVDTLSQAVAWYQQNLKAGDTVLFLNDLPDTY